MLARIARTITFFLVCALLTSSALAGGKKDRGGDAGGGISGVGIPPLTSTRVASGLVRPIYATHAPGDPTRLFIIEKQGRIRVLKIDQNPPVLLAASFLDIDSQVLEGTTTGSERGLLGLVFHPDYASPTNGYFYVYYTALSGANTVAMFQVSANPDIANGSGTTGTILLSIPDSENNHNGGWIGFKPDASDGYLYVATGDGGGGNDGHGTNGNGQNLTTIGGGTNVHVLFGKLLRLDIDGVDNIPNNGDDDGFPGDSTKLYTIPPSNPFNGGAAIDDEIWAYGLRNPWRSSFDRGTGDLYIADVGQNSWEEINFQPSASTGGENYGWRCMEGNNCTGLSGCTCEIGCSGGPLVCPIHQYAHGGAPFKCSISGGYVYRGSAIPELQGTYFFADYNCGQPGDAPIFSFTYSGGVLSNFVDRTAELTPPGGVLHIDSITGFGEDAAGEIYICDQDGGEVFKIIAAPPANDNCVAAPSINEGATAFSTVSATTDGPDETGGCGVGQINNDVWYRFTAQCNGQATVSLCGATFDTRLAAYASCPAAPGSTLACNDDSCGTASEICFPVVATTTYRIRVGAAAAGITGTGSLVLSCTAAPACPSDLNNSGATNVTDLLLLIGSWGACGDVCNCPADLNHNGTVNITDLLALISAWGNCV